MFTQTAILVALSAAIGILVSFIIQRLTVYRELEREHTAALERYSMDLEQRYLVEMQRQYDYLSESDRLLDRSRDTLNTQVAMNFAYLLSLGSLKNALKAENREATVEEIDSILQIGYQLQKRESADVTFQDQHGVRRVFRLDPGDPEKMAEDTRQLRAYFESVIAKSEA